MKVCMFSTCQDGCLASKNSKLVSECTIHFIRQLCLYFLKTKRLVLCISDGNHLNKESFANFLLILNRQRLRYLAQAAKSIALPCFPWAKRKVKAKCVCNTQGTF